MPLTARIEHNDDSPPQVFEPLWPGRSWTLVTFPGETQRKLIGFTCRDNDNGGVVHIVTEREEDGSFVTQSTKTKNIFRDGEFSEDILISAGYSGRLVLEHSCYIAAQ